jgi:putative addiction module antidote
MASLKVTRIGNSLGVILPREITDRLNIEKGDELAVVETPNGVELSPFDPDFAAKMKIARRVSRKYRNALRELAK